MNVTHHLTKNLFAILALFCVSCTSTSSSTFSPKEQEKTPTSMETNWKEKLTPEQYRILREKGTERAFTGKFNDHKQEGVYTCAGCETPLFESKTKFESGSGWPSFYDEIDSNVLEVPDNTHGMRRVEIVCSTCQGHLGHVFTDGPKPTGMRYCVNSLSLDFKEKP